MDLFLIFSPQFYDKYNKYELQKKGLIKKKAKIHSSKDDSSWFEINIYYYYIWTFREQ